MKTLHDEIIRLAEKDVAILDLVGRTIRKQHELEDSCARFVEQIRAAEARIEELEAELQALRTDRR